MSIPFISFAKLFTSKHVWSISAIVFSHLRPFGGFLLLCTLLYFTSFKSLFCYFFYYINEKVEVLLENKKRKVSSNSNSPDSHREGNKNISLLRKEPTLNFSVSKLLDSLKKMSRLIPESLRLFRISKFIKHLRIISKSQG